MSAVASGALNPQGPAARAMADLWWLMLALGVAVFAVFAVLLVLGLFRRPRTDSGLEERPSIGRWIVGGGVVLPLVLLVVVFGATVYAMREVETSPPPDALLVDVVGHQFRYEVSYPDHDVAVTDELRLPAGRPVALRLTSADVIHSFWVPELGGKLDMLPDGTNTLVLEADEPGEYTARCAEFCGLEHATMHLRVVVETPEAFDSWVAGQQ